jgi:hypothetical protein
MADYGVEADATQINGGEDEVMFGDDQQQQYNDFGAEEENPIDVDDVPVTQEDAWAVIS